jgi:hypothetical protein
MRTGTGAAASTIVSPIQLATPTHGAAAVSWAGAPSRSTRRIGYC